MPRFIALVVTFLFFGTAISANEKLVLTKKVIQSFQQVSSKWGALAQKHTDIGEKLQGLDLKSSASAVKFLEKSDIGKLLEQELKGSSFSRISDVLDFSKRFLGIKYYIEIKSSPSGVNLVDMVAILQSNVDRLEQDGADPKTIKTMQAQLEHHKTRSETIQYMLSLLDDEDKTYVDENLEWFKKVIAAESTNG